ncbi:MAG: hypothetical protein WAS23_15695 [Dokdonella sp.]|uniref:hypothetical protein n=1 Tax=Dokdonella sp. TaxID=2291710 RepID=UPI002B6F4EA2|nr:hypothetical protein [Dokdonella sp.]HOX72500.1 hypothetical protein [Dokdonella sp.]HPG93011.1 hypothetical protein [Dokdonella sp.]HPN79878.1 hypothetical protein [Dokdonella sp.]
MNRNRLVYLCICSATALSATAMAADSKIDTHSTGPAVAPVIRASTNTIINYPGGTAPANVVGTFDAGDSTFNRPLTCSTLSGTGTAVRFDTITLTNSGANPATVNIRLGQAGSPAAACVDPFDPYLVEYNGSFNPASPLVNCLQVNDDTAAAADRCPSFTGISVPSGATRVYVLTTFGNGVALNYEVTFAGTTPVSLQSFDVE